MLRGLFGTRKTIPPDAEGRERVAGFARLHGRFADGTVLTVSEIACADPSCPGDETVILIMEPGRKTCAVKVQLPLAEVTEEDVRAVLQPMEPGAAA